MSEQKHTPGPWKLLAVGDNNRLCPADQNNQSILTLEDEGAATFACVYKEADAHLIAAAPDLLEALKALKSASLHDENIIRASGFRAACERANAAIAKAEGRS